MSNDDTILEEMSNYVHEYICAVIRELRYVYHNEELYNVTKFIYMQAPNICSRISTSITA